MRRTSFTQWPCSIARTVDLLGDAWTLLVVREAYYGEVRFEGFVSTLGIARNTLTDRLGSLVEHGLLHRRQYQSDPVRHEYVLSGKGRDFFGVVVALNAWGDRWLSGEEGVPVAMHHTSCGQELHAEVTCRACHQPVELEDVSVAPGPGYPPRLAGDPAVIARFARRPPNDDA